MILKRIALMVVFATTLTLTATAQQDGERPHREQGQHQHRFSPEEFMQRLQAYVRSNVNFTDEEADKYFPLQREMYGELRQINDAMRELKQAINQQTTDEQATAAMVRLIELQQLEVQTRANYYSRMCEQLSASKVMLAIQAEDRFHREMLRQRGGDGQRGGHANGSRGGRGGRGGNGGHRQ